VDYNHTYNSYADSCNFTFYRRDFIFKNRGRKAYIKGRFILSVALAIIVFSWLQEYFDGKEQESRDLALNTTASNTSRLITNVDSVILKVEKTLARFTGLGIRLDSLEKETNSSIAKGSEVLTNFNRLNERLEKITLQEEFKIKENGPSVNILNMPKWIKNSNGEYLLNIEFSNSGDRIASELDIGVIFFGVNSESKVDKHKYLTTELQSTDLVPYKNGSNIYWIKSGGYPKNNPSETLSFGAIYVYYSYKDVALSSSFKRFKKYRYIPSSASLSQDKLSWFYADKTASSAIDEYIRSKRLTLITSSGMELKY
jgi:hypothetical protein